MEQTGWSLTQWGDIMKKKNLILIAAAVTVSLSACGSNNDISIPEATTQAESAVSEETTKNQEVVETTEADTPVGLSIYDPSTQPGANIPEGETVYAEPITIDINDCENFDQVIDKLATDMGYAEIKIGDTEMLLVTPETFKGDDEGTRAATIAEVFFIDKDNSIKDGGYVRSGGTATPLTASRDYIYASGHHYVKRYTLKEDVLKLDLEAGEKFDSDGKVSYYLRSELRDADPDKNGEVKDDSVFNDLNSEMLEADIISFKVK